MTDTKTLSQLNTTEAKTLLQKWREENTRCSESVRELWCLIQDDNLGDDRWPILEQVCLAALDLHDAVLIKDCISKLDKKFPNSSRVSRLKAMAKLELRSRYDEAQKCYNSLISNEKTNPLYYKRKVAILKSQQKNAEAIKELTEYLKKFMNDNEAWSELCDLYIGGQEYTKAAFCAEELILANPHNYLNHLRLAEIHYTINSAESLEQARSYYSHAHKLNRESPRVLYGLYLTTSALINQASVKSNNVARQKELSRLRDYAFTELQKLYQKASSESVNDSKSSYSTKKSESDASLEDLESLLEQAMSF